MPRKSIYELYEFLPKTNCGECGMSCMAFAGHLLARDVRPGDCPLLDEPEHEDKKRRLVEILGGVDKEQRRADFDPQGESDEGRNQIGPAFEGELVFGG